MIGEYKIGALFFIVSIPGGICLREEGGNSTETYGEVETALAIDRLVKNGMAPEDISVLSWYRGQVKDNRLGFGSQVPSD